MSINQTSPILNMFLNNLDQWMIQGKIGKKKREYVLAWLLTNLIGTL